MSASTKPVPGRQVRGMDHLKSKISNLQNQYQTLLTQRQQEIASLICTVDLAHLDEKTLVGGFLFLKDKITNQDPMTEAWHDAGEKFLRRRKGKTRPNCNDRKQEENHSQISEKAAALKQTAPPQPTPQLPQKPGQQRDE